MALTFRRWIAAAIVGCGLLALGLFTTKGSGRNRSEEFLEREARGTGADSARLVALRHDADSLERSKLSLHALVRQLTIRDSILASLGSKAAPDLTIAIDPRIPPQPRDRFRNAATSAYAAATSSTTATIASAVRTVPVVVAVVLDSNPRYRGTPGVTLAQLAVSYRGSPLCLAMVVAEGADPFSVARPLVDPNLLTGRILGQCAFQAAFGSPGPRVAAWLEQNPTLAQDTRWNVESLPILDDPSIRSEYLVASDMESAMEAVLRRRFVETPPRLFLGATALACDAGELDLCSSAVAEREAEWERGFALPYYAGRIFPGSGRLGPREVGLLADMVHDFGPAKFGAFWRSAQPLPAAFQDAMQESLGQWTSQWVRRLYGPVRVGPAPTASTLLDALVLMVVCVGVAIGIVSRRTVA